MLRSTNNSGKTPALSEADIQRLRAAEQFHRRRLGIEALRELIDEPNAVRVTRPDWHTGQLATIRHVEPKRGRLTLQLGPESWQISRCPHQAVEIARAGQ